MYISTKYSVSQSLHSFQTPWLHPYQNSEDSEAYLDFFVNILLVR